MFAKTSPFALNPTGGQAALGDGETEIFLRFFFFFTTTFFLTTGFLETVGFAVVFAVGVDLEVGFTVDFAVGVGVGFFVAACAGETVRANAVTRIIKRLIAIPPKFTDRKENSNT